MKKSTVIQTLNELPLRFELDELLERLMVDEALEDAKSGKTVSHDKVKKMVARWNK